MVKLNTLKLNDRNPRSISDDKFKKLVDSIKNFPKMMALRPMVANKDRVVIGGNMRYRACVAAGYTEVPDSWVRFTDDMTPEEEARFIIEDNVQFGQWDWEELANTWNSDLLDELGLDFPNIAEIPEAPFKEEKAKEEKDENWLYVDFGEDLLLFEELVRGLESIEALEGPHQMKADVFVAALKQYVRKCQQ